jgi:hypothetical protein
LKNLLENAPEHCFGPPFSARGVLVRPDDRGIDERAEFVFVGFEPKLFEDGLPAPRLGPAMEAVVDRLPVAVPLREVTPLHAGANADDDSVDEVAVPALGAGSRARRNQGRDAVPLSLREFVSVHSQR